MVTGAIRLDERETPATPVADRQLDCRGELCPMPVYKAAMAMRALGAGQVLEILCTDPGSLKDFPAFARQAGHELLTHHTDDGVQVFRIRKGGA